MHLGEAMDAPELEWTTDGDEVWMPTTVDGLAAGASGHISDLNVSFVETTVEGLGVIGFEWKVSSELDADVLTFSIDGADQPGHISGEMDWEPITFSIPTGRHALAPLDLREEPRPSHRARRQLAAAGLLSTAVIGGC